MNQVKMLPVVNAIHSAVGLSVSRTTAHRWTTTGHKGVILKSWRVVGKRLSTEEAVKQFIDAINTELPPTTDGEGGVA